MTTDIVPGSLGIRLPMVVDDITPAWLTAALGIRSPGIEVVDVEVIEVLWGTCTKVRLHATYAADRVGDPPRALCVKACLDERVRAAVGGISDASMRLEGDFYRDLAPSVGAGVPPVWFADSAELQGIVILDDLGAQGVEFGSPAAAWGPDRMAAALDELAKLHGPSWGRTYPQASWLRVGAATARGAIRHLFSPAHWDAFFASPEAPHLPLHLQDRARNLRAYERLWADDDIAQHCLAHGDAHVGNTYVLPDGRPRFLDWANVSYAPWSSDVTYCLVSAMDPEIRRANERGLLEGYLVALEHYGGPRLARDQAWEDYRRHAWQGLVWATLPSVMQPGATVATMTERYVAAIEDHAALDLLAV